MTEVMKTEDQPEVKAKFSKINLGELGAKFPIPVLDPTGKALSDQTFSFLEWDLDLEEKIGSHKEKSKNVGEFVNHLLCEVIDRYCGMDFQSKPKEQRMLIISMLEFPNVMYAYIMLRTEELGYGLKMDVTCPVCGKMNKDFVADLKTLEVHCKDHEKHVRKYSYDLVKPIRMPDEKIITGVTIDVAKWNAMESAGTEVSENPSKMKKVLLKSAVCGVSTAQGPIEGFYDLDAVLSKLKKVDIEKLLAEVSANNAGPHMAVGGKCVHCRKEWVKNLDWGYDYFFDSSSL